ncbi:MAG: nucleoside deaminase [Betaproteobacteria bacterium]
MEQFDRIDHELYMRAALEEARQAFHRGDRPIGAVIVHDGRIIGTGSNKFSTTRSHIAHAELDALLNCASYLYDHGHECIMYSTAEPCMMCLGAIVMANIRNVVFGMHDNHLRARDFIAMSPYVRRRIHNYLGGVLENECIALYRRYSEQEADLMVTGMSRS